MHHHEYGFSLIELMIVVSIISILAMTAIPTYQHYTMRARFAEVIAATMPLKTAVALALQSGADKMEISDGTHWLPDESIHSKNIEQIQVKNAIITATATALAKNATYTLIPNHDGSQWQVEGSCLELGLCRDS